MNVTTTSSQQITANVMNGNDQKAAFAASIRPGKGLNINVEIVDTDYAVQNGEAIANALDAFLTDIMTRAQAASIPVNVTVHSAAETATE